MQNININTAVLFRHYSYKAWLKKTEEAQTVPLNKSNMKHCHIVQVNEEVLKS